MTTETSAATHPLDWWTEPIECSTCKVEHSRAEWHSLGMLCGRCEQHTGNNHQGHYWKLCKAGHGTPTSWGGFLADEFHFCCPDNCALDEAK